MSGKTILHIDMNAFFAAVEQQSNPVLRGKPVAVCGRGRTVVATCSYEARRMGVRTAMSLYEARKLCPDIIFVEGSYARYVDTAKRIHEICMKFTDRIEVFSVDEVFMDVTGALHLFNSGKDIALEIKRLIKKEMGLTCSIGIAPSKILAKLASGMEKPDGLVVIRESDIEGLMSHTPVEDLCGIGEKTKKHLNRLGIVTAKDLGEADVNMLRREFGFTGNLLKELGRGRDISPVSFYNESDIIKSVGHSCTLPRDTANLKVIRSFLLMLSQRVAARLRSYGRAGRTVTLHLRYSDFSGCSRQNTLDYNIKTASQVYSRSCKILKSFYPFRKAVRLIGVTVSGLSDDKNRGFLFNRMDSEKLEEAVDSINNKFGEMFIRPLACDIANEFTAQSIDIPARIHGFLPALKRRSSECGRQKALE